MVITRKSEGHVMVVTKARYGSLSRNFKQPFPGFDGHFVKFRKRIAVAKYLIYIILYNILLNK